MSPDNKIWTCLLVVFLLLSCGKKESKTAPVAPVEVSNPIAMQEDTTGTREEAEAANPPEAIENEFFDEFIFDFASDSVLQLQRIHFPLSYYKEDVSLKLGKEEWRTKQIFSPDNQQFSIILDREEDLDMLLDTARVSIQVELVFMDSLKILKYYFERVEGRWMLEALNLHPIKEGVNRDFVKFLAKFANDSLYQSEHVSQPLQFVTTDPDDDFSILETTLDVNQWHAFKPLIPKKVMVNINYGQTNDERSRQKIVQVKDIGNGFINTLFFRKRDNVWKLYKFEDTSN